GSAATGGQSYTLQFCGAPSTTPTATATLTGKPSPPPTATSTTTPTAPPTAPSTAPATSTASAPATATATIVATPTPCQNYSYTVSTGSIVPGTTDTGNHTDDNSTLIGLPFTYRLSDTNFNNVRVGSNGHLTFGTVVDSFNATCMPQATTTYSIFPYRTGLCACTVAGCVSNVGTTYGIFTSTSGSAPNRIFNIEWRAAYYN